MSRLKGWGGDADDTRFEVEVEHVRTGQKRMFVLVAPVGAEALDLYRVLMDIGPTDTVMQLVLAGLPKCCEELSAEAPDALERLLTLTGGLRSPLVGAVLSAIGMHSDAGAGAEEVPFSSSGSRD